MRRIYLLTQFLSASLHRHVYGSFKFDHFSRGFVEILAAEQSLTDTSSVSGHGGTARPKESHPFPQPGLRLVLILSGDSTLSHGLFGCSWSSTSPPGRMSRVSAVLVRRDAARSLGIMPGGRRASRRAVRGKSRTSLRSSTASHWTGSRAIGLAWRATRRTFWPPWASISSPRVSLPPARKRLADFGKHIIPGAIETQRVFAYVFNGYWEDIGRSAHSSKPT